MAALPEPHAAMAQLLARLASARAGQPSRYAMPFPEARAQLLAEREPWLDDGPACGLSFREFEAPGGRVGMQVVRPAHCEGHRVLVYLHGGGWCVGSPRTHEAIVRRLAQALRCEAWSIDYALAPEHPYPAGLEDCLAAIDQAARSFPGARVIVAGDSAGANLALESAIRLRDRREEYKIAALLLFYGVYSRSFAGESMAAFGDGRYDLSVVAQQRYQRAYLGQDPDGSRDAGIVPHTGFALDGGIDLHDLPRSFLLAAQIDILRDQSLAMAAALRAAGNQVEELEVRGVTHGFLAYGKAMPGDVDDAIHAAAGFALRD